MTISQAIDMVDQERPNAYPEKTKRIWLEQMDKMAWREILSTHENAPEEPAGYFEEEAGDKELLIPEDYKLVYIYWMFAMMDYRNQETTRYTNDMIMFNQVYADFGNFWNRTHMPLGQCVQGANAWVRR